MRSKMMNLAFGVAVILWVGPAFGQVCIIPDTCPTFGNVCFTTTCPNIVCVAVPLTGNTCTDGNACTQTDTCQAGTCVGSNPVVCPVPDQCHDVGTCNTTTAVCSNPPKADNTLCDDGLFCTGQDFCRSGVCSGNSGDPCVAIRNPNDGCKQACNEAADNCTANDPTGAVCNDDLFCNGLDTCNGTGMCLHAGNPCPGPDNDSDCKESCDEANNSCTLYDGDGAACNNNLFCDGTDKCLNGTCSDHTGDPCLPLKTTDANCAQSCNETADNCTAPDPNNTGCNDALFCNGTDTCNGSGSCATHTGDPCLASRNPAGTCLQGCVEATDLCNGPENALPCSDGIFCNGTDTCVTGSCTTHKGNPCTGNPECDNTCNEGPGNCFTDQGITCNKSGGSFQCSGLGDCVSLAVRAPAFSHGVLVVVGALMVGLGMVQIRRRSNRR